MDFDQMLKDLRERLDALDADFENADLHDMDEMTESFLSFCELVQDYKKKL